MPRKGHNKKKQLAQPTGQLRQKTERLKTPEPQQTATPAATPATNRFLPIGKGREEEDEEMEEFEKPSYEFVRNEFLELGQCLLFELGFMWESMRGYEEHRNTGRISARTQEADLFTTWYQEEIRDRVESALEHGASLLDEREHIINTQKKQIEDLENQVQILLKKSEAHRAEKEGLLKKVEKMTREKEEREKKWKEEEEDAREFDRKRANRVLELQYELNTAKEKLENGMAELRKEHGHTITQQKRKVTEVRDACDKLKEQNGKLKSTLAQVTEAKAQLEKEKEEKMEVDRPDMDLSIVSTWHYPPVEPPPPQPPQLLFPSGKVSYSYDFSRKSPPPVPAFPKRTYAQAATQTSPPAATTTTQSGNSTALPERYAFVEDMSDYEKEEIGGRKNKQIPQTLEFIARAAVMHGVPTNWQKEWVAQQTGWHSIVGVRWLLNQQRRQGKKTSSLVIYWSEEVVIPYNPGKIGGRKMRMVPYDFDR